MLPDRPHGRVEIADAEPVTLRNGGARVEPDLGFAAGTLDVDVHARLHARKG